MHDESIQTQRAERSRTLIGARAHFNEGRSSVDCQIRNISATGARLLISSVVPVPRDFLLEVPSRNQTYKVVLRWRRSDSAGVEFIDSCAADPRDAETVFGMTLDELRSEVITLRRQRAELTDRLAKLGHSEWRDVMINKTSL